MTKHDILKITTLIFIGIIFTFSTVNAQSKSESGEKVGKTVKVKNKNIIWDAFDTTSFIAINKIEIKDLQGLWNANKGVYLFDGKVNAMELSEPFIMEVKDNTYRRNSKGAFNQFYLKDNLIIKNGETKIDTGIINKITPTELTISWKSKANYTRYYYKK
jgi:hypothetical protein